MTDAFKWFDRTATFITNNKPLFLAIIGLISSASTNIVQFVENISVKEQVVNTQKQVATVAESYRPYVIKTPVASSNCNSCSVEIKKHEVRYH